MGLAIGDGATGTVSPLEVVAYGGLEDAARRIEEAAARLEVRCIVLGLPTLANGSTTGGATRSERLAATLRGRGLRVELQPEFLSTNEARRRARAAKRRRQEPIDDLAAQVILEEFLADTVAGSRDADPP
jgi:putative transcription antitermination factor YqgF